jgi:hypothetical protein
VERVGSVKLAQNRTNQQIKLGFLDQLSEYQLFENEYALR